MAADVASALKDWSTTAASNSPAGSTAISTNLDDNLREIQAVVRDLAAANTVASATTTDIGAVNETFLTISGTTTITGLGTVSAGIYKWLIFSGALTLTHNATSLILPAGANITTAAGDVACMLSLGSGNWRCLVYSRADGSTIGAVSMNDGTVSAPGLDFILDANTGIYRVGTDTIGIAAGGVAVLRLGSSVNQLSSYTGGDLVVTSTQGAINTNAPDIEITAADVVPASSSAVNGGSIVVTAGQSSTNGIGGSVTLVGGDNTGGQAGSVVLNPGVGNDASEAGTVQLNDDAGNTVLGVNGVSGHLFVSNASGAPTMTNAGSGHSVAGNDCAFKVTLGSGATSPITAAFANAFLAAPVVHAQYQSSSIACRAVSTTTEVVITLASAPAEGGILDVICIGTSGG